MFERFTREARQVVMTSQRYVRESKGNRIGTEHLLLALLDPGSGTPAAILAEAGLDGDQVRAGVVRLTGGAIGGGACDGGPIGGGVTGTAEDGVTGGGATEGGATEATSDSAGRPFGEDDARALESLGIDLDAVRRKIEETFGPGSLDMLADLDEQLGAGQRTDRRTGRGWAWREWRDRSPRRGRVPFSRSAKIVLELSLREAIRFHNHEIRSEHILLGLLRLGVLPERENLAAKIMVEAGADIDDVRHRTEASLRRAA